MAEWPSKFQATREGEANPPPSGLTAKQFEALPEFRRFKTMMRRLLRTPKHELDRRIKAARIVSPRIGNHNAPGRKPKTT